MTETEYKEVRIGPKVWKIPHEWSVSNLDPENGLTSQVTDGSHHSPNQEENQDYFYATVSDLSDTGIDYSSCGKIDREQYEEMVEGDCKPEEGDVLFSKDGTVGICTVFENDMNVVLLSSIAIIRPTQEIDSRFLKEFLSSKQILDQIRSFKSGTAIRRVVLRDIKKFSVPLPPLSEQRRIAEILSTVDEAIQQTDEIIETSKELKKGLMQDLLTKGIGHDEFKEVQLGPKSIEFPEEWSTKMAGELFEIRKDRVDPSELDEVVDLYSMPAFDKGKEPKKEETSEIGSKKYLVPDDTLLFPKLNIRKQRFWRVKRESEKKGICSTEYWPLIPQEDLDLDFYNFYFRTHEFRSHPKVSSSSSTNSHKRVNQSSFEKVKLPVPPLDEQREIAEKLSVVDEKIRQEEEYREKLEELKKGLMQDLLTGEVRVEPEEA